MSIQYESLVGDPEQFATEIRDKRPLLRKAAFSDPSSLLSYSDLDRLLDSEAIRPPYTRITRNGATVREADFTRLVRVQLTHVDDVPDVEKIKKAFQTGATLTWNSMNHYVPALRELTTVLSENLGCRTDVVAFATPASVRGFAPHLDSTEVFVIQTAGTKKWTVWDTWRPRPAAGRVVDISTLGEPAMQFIMEPGDCLYLPWGTPHVAESQDAPSLHLSVTAKPATWADLVGAVVDDVLNGEDFAEFPVLAPSNIVRITEALADRLRRTAELLTDAKADLHANKLIRDARPSFGIGRTDFFEKAARTYEPFSGAEQISRAHAEIKAVVQSQQSDEKVVVEIGQRVYAVPAALTPGLDIVNREGSCTFAELAAILGDEDLTTSFVRGFADAGFLAVERVPN